MSNETDNSKVNNQQAYVEYDDDFSLADFLEIIAKSKRSIILMSMAFFLASSIYTLFTPDIYTSDSLLTIVDDSEAGGSGFDSIASRYGGLASLAGVSMAAGSANKSDLIIATIKSRGFFEYIAKLPGIYPPLVASESYDAKTKTLILNKQIYSLSEEKWVSGAPSFLSSHYEFFIKKLTISADKKTGFISIAFNHISPEFAYKMVKTLIQEANNLIRLQHIEEADRALVYLNSELQNTAEIGTKDSISTLINAQLKVQMLANVREDYILRAIDDPVQAEWPSGPNRLRIILISTIIGLLFGAFLGLFLHYFRQKN